MHVQIHCNYCNPQVSGNETYYFYKSLACYAHLSLDLNAQVCGIKSQSERPIVHIQYQTFSVSDSRTDKTRWMEAFKPPTAEQEGETVYASWGKNSWTAQCKNCRPEFLSTVLIQDVVQ